MKRKEIKFSIDHSQNGGTPPRNEIIMKLATLLKTKNEFVYVKNMKTKTGTMTTIGQANIYKSIDDARALEPKHIISRNKLPEKVENTNSQKDTKDEAVK